MEQPEWGYLYTVALCAIAFVSFSIIALVLRESIGGGISKLHLFRMRQYIEGGLVAVAFALMPPLLAICGLPLATVWRVSSVIIAASQAIYVATVPIRWRSVTKDPLPLDGWVFLVSWIPIILWLVANAIASEPNGSSVAVAATWRLASVIIIFMITLNEFLTGSRRR